MYISYLTIKLIYPCEKHHFLVMESATMSSLQLLQLKAPLFNMNINLQIDFT